MLLKADTLILYVTATVLKKKYCGQYWNHTEMSVYYDVNAFFSWIFFLNSSNNRLLGLELTTASESSAPKLLLSLYFQVRTAMYNKLVYILPVTPKLKVPLASIVFLSLQHTGLWVYISSCAISFSEASHNTITGLWGISALHT